jgi:hypothetical protein
MVNHSSIKGCCPYHQENTPSFFLKFNNGFGKCFGQCEKFVTDLISVIAKIRVCSYTEALLFLNTRFGLSGIYADKFERFNDLHLHQEAKKATAIALNSVLSEVIRDDPPYLSYCRPAIDYLINVRKLPMETLPHLPVGVFAKPEHIHTYVQNPMLHPIIDSYFEKYQNTVFWGALVFHYNDSPGTISRFKFRIWDPKISTFGHDFFYVQDQYTSDIGIYGLHKYARRIGANETNAYITEGEFDVLSVMAQQDLNNTPDFMIFATGGKGSTDVNFLSEYGIKTVWVIPDHPAKAGSDAYAIGILNTKPNPKLKPMSFKMFQWPVDIQGMDLDDAVKLNSYKHIYDYLVTQKSAYFMNATPWIINKCNIDLAQAKREYSEQIEEVTDQTEIVNLKDELKTKMTDIMLRWFNIVHDPADRITFTNNYTNTENIDISQLSQVANAMYSLDTYEGVVNKVSTEFMNHFSFAYYQARQGEVMFSIWVKQKRVLEDLKHNDRNLYSFIALHVGCSVSDWFDRMFPGNPIYLEGIEELHSLKAGEQKIQHSRRILDHAFANVLHKAKPRSDLFVRAQGVHYSDLPSEAKRMGHMYFVNGKKVFRGVFPDQDVIEWELLDNVVDSGILFEGLSLSEEWSFVDDVSDLYSGVNVDLQAEYQMIQSITRAWKFQHDDIIQQYLPAYIMSVPVMRAIGQVNMTYITGDSQSGKTSLVHGLLGGTRNHAHKVPVILEAAEFASNVTGAGFYQSVDGKSNLYIIDEAERSSNHTTHQDENIGDVLRLSYGITQGGVDVVRGGVSKDLRVRYNMHLPMMFAAINMPTDTTFLSRVMIIQTAKEMGREPPENYIGDMYDATALAELRKNITIGLLNKVPSIIRHSRIVQDRLAPIGREVGFVSNRFLNSVLIPITVYDYIGVGTAEDLYKEILVAFRDRLKAIHYADFTSDIIDACLYRETIKYQNISGTHDVVSAKALIRNNDYDILNSSDVGVYIMRDHGWLVLVWRQIKHTIFANTEYSRYEESAMRERAAKSKWVEQEITPDVHKLIKETLNLHDVRSPLEYTVLDADYLMDCGGTVAAAAVTESLVLPTAKVNELDDPIRKRKKK